MIYNLIFAVKDIRTLDEIGTRSVDYINSLTLIILLRLFREFLIFRKYIDGQRENSEKLRKIKQM